MVVRLARFVEVSFSSDALLHVFSGTVTEVAPFLLLLRDLGGVPSVSLGTL